MCGFLPVCPSARLRGRAACRLKVGGAEAALTDATAVLEQAPDNVKALFRSGQARAALKVR